VVKDGQGVYGLRRAFFVAGAGTTVMSLWPVADGETQSLMQTYYSLLLDRKANWGRIAALWQAMRTIKKKRPHPYYWAPFIGLGQDAPLSLN
jgi:CHAT domain-containing protein